MNFKIAGLMVLFLLALGGVTWATEPWVVDGNTLALYHCEETEGTTVTDANGSLDGVASDNALLGDSTAKVGTYSIHPDGAYYFTQGTLLDSMPENGTIELWFTPDVNLGTSHTIQYLLEKFTRGATNYNELELMFDANDNRLRWNNRYGAGEHHLIYSAGRTWVADTWYHICVTWGALGTQIYINGVLEGHDEEVTGHPGDGTAGEFTMGGQGNFVPTYGYQINGKIDEIRVSDIQRDCTTTSPTTTTTTSTTTTTVTTTTTTTTVTTTTTTTTLEPTTTTTLEPTTTTTIPGTTTTTLAPGEAVTNNSYLLIILLIIGLFLAIVLI